MQIILLQDVAKIGKKYEEKKIADGYARNALIPLGKAIIATEENRKRILQEKGKRGQEKEKKVELFEKALLGLFHEKITFKAKANELGHLFAGIDKEEIRVALKRGGILDIESQYIDLPHPIKEIGEHTVGLHLGDKRGEITIVVESEK